MRDALSEAAREAVEAADNADQLRTIAAVLQAQQIMSQVQQHQCQHQPPRPEFNAKKWWTIGCLAIAGACTVCALALAFALASIAIAVGATCATVCLLVLRSMWRDLKNQ
jgi:ABC-type Fe3+ transport system permease subunit